MPEIERSMVCENCGSACRMIYDNDDVRYEPENCPFCGELVGVMTDELSSSYDENDDNDDEEVDE